MAKTSTKPTSIYLLASLVSAFSIDKLSFSTLIYFLLWLISDDTKQAKQKRRSKAKRSHKKGGYITNQHSAIEQVAPQLPSVAVSESLSTMKQAAGAPKPFGYKETLSSSKSAPLQSPKMVLRSLQKGEDGYKKLSPKMLRRSLENKQSAPTSPGLSLGAVMMAKRVARVMKEKQAERLKKLGLYFIVHFLPLPFTLVTRFIDRGRYLHEYALVGQAC